MGLVHYLIYHASQADLLFLEQRPIRPKFVFTSYE